MDRILFENKNIKVLVEEHEIPWVKIFTIKPFKELSHTPKEIRYEIFDLAHIIEQEMIAYFNPDKINIASFGNYVPHVHLHIQARFKTDSFFPEPTWGKQQRESQPIACEEFYERLDKTLNEVLNG